LFLQPILTQYVVFEIMLKASTQPLPILSAFARDSLRGEVFVEASSERDIQHALRGIHGVYLFRGIHLVPLEEKIRILTLRDLDDPVIPGSWVRPKRGKYKGDLGLVLTVNHCILKVALVPRIPMILPDPSLKGKRKQPPQCRPPQRLFNFAEIVDVYGLDAVKTGDGSDRFNGDVYKNGMLEKVFDLTGLKTQDVNPSMDEVKPFHSIGSSSWGAIRKLIAQNAVVGLSPGDTVQIISGEQQGLRGELINVGTDVVRVILKTGSSSGQLVDVPSDIVQKYFESGDYVKVRVGTERGRSGWVIACDQGVVTLYEPLTSTHVCLQHPC
jgi:transcription elongation factor SPT5